MFSLMGFLGSIRASRFADLGEQSAVAVIANSRAAPRPIPRAFDLMHRPVGYGRSRAIDAMENFLFMPMQ